MLKINVMDDDELRKQILDLIRDQIRPLVTKITNNGIEGEIRARVSKMLDNLDLREHVATHVKYLATQSVSSYADREALRDMVREAVANRVDILIVAELRQVIQPIVKDALKEALRDMIK